MHSKSANCWMGEWYCQQKEIFNTNCKFLTESKDIEDIRNLSLHLDLFSWKSLWHHPQPQSHHSRKESSPGGCHPDHQHHFTSSLSGRQRATETLEGKRQVDVMQLPLAYSTYSPKISWGTLLYLCMASEVAQLKILDVVVNSIDRRDFMDKWGSLVGLLINFCHASPIPSFSGT